MRRTKDEDEDESDFLLPNKTGKTVESENFLLSNSMEIEAERSNITISKLQKCKNMSERQSLGAEKRITHKSGTFFNNINEWKERIARPKCMLISSIIENIKTLFSLLKENPA